MTHSRSGSVFGALTFHNPAFQSAFSGRIHKNPTFACTFGALICKLATLLSAFNAFICKIARFSSAFSALIYPDATLVVFTHLQNCQIFQCFQCIHLQKCQVFQCFQCTHLLPVLLVEVQEHRNTQPPMHLYRRRSGKST